MPWSLRIALIVLRATAWPRLCSPPRIPRVAPDFLWFMSSGSWLGFPQLLARHRREVILIVVRCVTLPHDEDDLQPRGAQRPERLTMGMSPRPLLVVVRPSPFAGTEREERDLIDHVPQRGVAGEAEVHDALLAAALGHRHGARLSLEMAKRLPPLGDVAQTGPKSRGRDALVTDRQRPNPLRRRLAGEKILDGLAVLADGRHHRGEFCHQGPHQPGLGPHHVGRHGQLRLLEDLPELPGPGSRSSDGRAPTAATDVS